MIPFVVEDTDGSPGGSALLDRILGRLTSTLDSIRSLVTNERLVRVTFTAATTDTPVIHGVNGIPLTWEIVDTVSDVNVWRSDTVNAQPRKIMIFQASAPAVVLLRFT